eukprot:CAMPEP_0170391680 /NCGR_PEP_ID=MMETSP0117_2-20130122/19797_1 /TAXON_ID=400756 /ORGANISM="Durinskia baltica, Strain CSIRO CS-38" /LENGTH=463 /DNA_ID=CAMNT_0010647785 /DNA_START=209 /DNA_END=1598 /DNA_ORIENTATION=-
MVLHQQAVVVVPPDSEHLPQALVDEEVLAPVAMAAALGPEVLAACAPAAAPRLNSFPGKNLDRPVQAVFAVVQVHPRGVQVLRMPAEVIAEAIDDEHRVRVNLDGPVVRPEGAHKEDLGPHGDEDVEVQGRAKLPALFAAEVAVDGPGAHVLCDRHLLVAEHVRGLAGEKARPLLGLHRQELLLVAPRHHHGEAVQAARVRRRRRPIEGLLHGAPAEELPLLVPIVRVARSHVDHAPVDLALARLEADPLPTLHEACDAVVGPLLLRGVEDAVPDLDLGEVLRLVDRLHAQSATGDLPGALVVSPALRRGGGGATTEHVQGAGDPPARRRGLQASAMPVSEPALAGGAGRLLGGRAASRGAAGSRNDAVAPELLGPRVRAGAPDLADVRQAFHIATIPQDHTAHESVVRHFNLQSSWLFSTVWKSIRKPSPTKSMCSSPAASAQPLAPTNTMASSRGERRRQR